MRASMDGSRARPRAPWHVLLVVIACLVPIATFATAADAAKPDACALVTAADLQDQFDRPFTRADQAGSATDCSSFTPEAPVISVRLIISTAPNVKAAKELLKVKSKPPPLSDGTLRRSKKVKGVGDDARYLPLMSTGSDSYLASVLFVRSGKILFSLIIGSTDDSGNAIDDKPASISLAKVAVGRL